MDGLGKGPALADDDDVSFLDSEGGGAVHGDVSVPLFVTIVFGDVVEVITPYDDGPLHLGGDGNSLEDLSPDGDVAGEGALLVNIAGFNGFLGGLEAQSNILEVSNTGGGLLGEQLLAVEEDILLLLEGSFVLWLDGGVPGCRPSCG